MVQSICSVPEIEQKMEQLAGQLETVKGKKSYGYLPKSVKKTVDEVVDKLEVLPVVRECYGQWCVLQSEVESYYHDKPREKKKLSQEKAFRQIKNTVIQEAECIRLGEITFEDADLAGHDEPEQMRVSPIPAGTAADRPGRSPFLWQSGTAQRRSWSGWRSEVMPTPNTCWVSFTGTVLC